MIKYSEIKVVQQTAASVICDVCKKEFSFDKDFLETQEFHRIDFRGGYGSVFGDGVSVTCDICQHCLHELIKDYCKKDEEK